jgi:hypothetical protein
VVLGQAGPVHLTRRRRLGCVGAGALVATAGLAGCSAGGGGTPAQTVTVTHTSASPSPSSTATPSATSDVKGRAFDLGTVARVSTVGGVLVVELDRWTLPGTSDSTIARQGVQVVPHRGGRYTNQNDRKTYTAPVADGANVVVNRCVPGPDGQLGLESAPQGAADWLAQPDTKTVLVVTYDEAGAITRLDTDPRC